MLSLEPEIFGTTQPEPATLTVVVLVPDGRPGQVNVFITNNETDLDRVRLMLRPGDAAIQDDQYIMYDTPIVAGHTVTISQVFVSAGDQIIAWSQQGACAFTVSGTAFVYDQV